MTKLNYSINWNKAIDKSEADAEDKKDTAEDALDKQKTLLMGLQKNAGPAQSEIKQTTTGFGRTSL